MDDEAEAALEDASHEERLRAAEQAVEEEPGWLAYQRWQELGRTLNVHMRNLRSLAALIDSPNSDADLAMELIQNVHPPHVRNEFFAGLDQFLHNALASAVTLVDHTRRRIDRYEGTEFAAEFTLRNNLIKNDPRAVFIRRLRNYLLHYGELPFQHRVSFGGLTPLTNLESQVHLPSAALLAWDGWTAPARSFLEASEFIDLGTLIVWYRAATDDLYAWVVSRFESLHRDELKAADAVIANYNRILTGEG